MANIIDGKALSQKVKEQLKVKVAEFEKKSADSATECIALRHIGETKPDERNY